MRERCVHAPRHRICSSKVTVSRYTYTCLSAILILVSVCVRAAFAKCQLWQACAVSSVTP